MMATILIVDDQPANRYFLATLLGYFRHAVLEAADGGEAMESLRTSSIDLVIADVLMPTMDGYDFLQRMRGTGGFETPVIFYTAVDYEPAARAMAEGLGVRHFLGKPAEPEQILAAVNSALGLGALASPASFSKFNRRVLAAPADPIDPESVVYVVEDDVEARHRLSEILHAAGLKIEAFSSAEEFLDHPEAKKPSCLILDVRLTGMSGIALLENLRSRRSHIPTIILTAHAQDVPAADAIRLRVMDFIEKPVESRILMPRVYRALQEDAIRRRDLNHAEAVRNQMGTLTGREKALVTLLVRGKSSKQIAAELGISVKTVSNHRTKVMAKTSAINVADLVRISLAAAGGQPG